MDFYRNNQSKNWICSSFLVIASLSAFWCLTFSDYMLEPSLKEETNSTLNKNTNAQKLENLTNHQKSFKFNNIEFFSLFESGNLKEVLPLSKYHYSLKIGSDPSNSQTKSRGQKNWFYFFVKTNFSTIKPIKLSIPNFQKNWAIWTHGCALTYKSNVQTNNTWKIFNATDFKLIMKAKALLIEFIYTFQISEEVSFAITFPYGLSDLNTFIDQTSDFFNNSSEVLFQREALIKSNLGNNIDLLTISGKNNISKFFVPKMKHLFPMRTSLNKSTWTPLFHKSKKVFIISARVHPSETASSFMLEGLINYFKKESLEMSTFLAENVIYIIPMLNPDGVINGFTRCDANGFNLNDKYKDSDLSTPSIYALKKLIRYHNNRSKVHLFLDFHSHFTKRGFFVFGNPLRKKNYKQILEFPVLLKSVQRDFSLKQSKFGSNKQQESTSRKELYKHTRMKGIYTIEVNYWGKKENIAKLKANKLIQNNLRKINDFSGFYDVEKFRNYGESVGKAILQYQKRDLLENEKKKLKMTTQMDRFWLQMNSKSAKKEKPVNDKGG